MKKLKNTVETCLMFQPHGGSVVSSSKAELPSVTTWWQHGAEHKDTINQNALKVLYFSAGSR